MTRSSRLRITGEGDVARAVVATRGFAVESGMRPDQASRLATAASELARNILKYAGVGEVALRFVEGAGRSGVEIVVQDRGPGIADPAAALSDHYSSGGTLGLGLPGVKRLMDEFSLESKVGEGTRVTAILWK